SRIALAQNPHDVVFDRHVVGRQVHERRRARRGAVVQLEAGVMPRATQRLADEHSLIEWCSIVRALSADGEPVRLRVRQQNRLPEGMTSDELAGSDATRRDPFGEIRPRQLLGVFAHLRWSRRFCARSRTSISPNSCTSFDLALVSAKAPVSANEPYRTVLRTCIGMKPRGG